MTVLVAYNDSPQGEAALRAGAAEAVRRELPLAIFVLTPLEGLAQADPPSPDLAHLLDALPAGTPVPTVTYRESRVDPADAILDEAERLTASLVVIGSRKRSPSASSSSAAPPSASSSTPTLPCWSSRPSTSPPHARRPAWTRSSQVSSTSPSVCSCASSASARSTWR
ncbi:universal stress protein [Oerskovia sp. M15]